MKMIVKRLTLLTLACLMVFSLAACGDNDEEQSGSGVDFSTYTEDFDKWTIADMRKYLSDCGLLGNESFILMDLSPNEVEAMKATGAFMYVDTELASVNDIVLFYDASNPESKEVLDAAKRDRKILGAIDMHAILGGFCFSYLDGTDDGYIASFVQALRDLSSHYSVEFAFIEEG